MSRTATTTETSDDLVAAAQHALDLVGEDPRRALAEADELVARIPQPRGRDEVGAFAVAQRAAGLSLRSLGDPVGAQRRMKRGMQMADRRGEVEVAAEVRMSLAFVMLDLGRTRAALALTDEALGVLRGVKAARARTIRALVLQRSQRPREAFAEYDAALPVLRRAHDDDWTARLRHNRGLLRIELGETEAAVADLEWVRKHDLAQGRTADAADALFNLGVARAFEGDIPEALGLFDRAEAEWGGLVRPEASIARADALLSVGLASEAVPQLARAVEWLHERGWSRLEVQARLLLASALLASEPPDAGSARDQASAARELLAGPDRAEWEPFALYVITKADLLAGPGSAAIGRAASIASTLRDMGTETLAADLRIAAGSRALEAGDLVAARTVLGPLAVQERSRYRDVAGRAYLAQGLLAEAAGDQALATRCLRRAWALVEQQRALLGASELRAASAAHAEAIVTAGLRIAVPSTSVTSVFTWAELGRAAVLRYRPANPPGDVELAQALARLRWTVAEADSADGLPLDSTKARNIVQREADVLAVTRRIHGRRHGTKPVSVRDVEDHLSDGIFLQFVSVEQRIGVVILGAGRPKLIDLGPSSVITSAVADVTFGLRRGLLGFRSGREHRGGPDFLAHRVRALDDLLFASLRQIIGGRDVVLCPSADLTGVPWMLLPSTQNRVVRVAPSATVWCLSHNDGAASPGRVLAVAGPGLAGGRDEVMQIGSMHSSVAVLLDEKATVDAVLRLAQSSDILHIAAHGQLRKDNPLFSSLQMADGPLTGYHFESLDPVPRTIVLSACSSGAGHANVAEETLGLAWILMGSGASTVLAPLLPVPDEATRNVMVDLHRRLAAGTPPATALAELREHADEESTLVAGAFVAYGT